MGSSGKVDRVAVPVPRCRYLAAIGENHAHNLDRGHSFSNHTGVVGVTAQIVHIVFLNTLRHVKTKSEVLGPSITWFGNNGRFNFLVYSNIAPFFLQFLYSKFMRYFYSNRYV